MMDLITLSSVNDPTAESVDCFLVGRDFHLAVINTQSFQINLIQALDSAEQNMSIMLARYHPLNHKRWVNSYKQLDL